MGEGKGVEEQKMSLKQWHEAKDTENPFVVKYDNGCWPHNLCGATR